MEQNCPTEIDEKDVDILASVGKRKTVNLQIISEETDIPESTVNYRLRKLQEQGVLRNDLFEVDLEKFGLPVTVISEVNGRFEKGYHSEVGEKLADIEGVNQVYFTMGETDFLVVSHLHDRAMVQQLVESFERVEGVERTSSKFVIESIKRSSFHLRNFDGDTLTEII